MKRTLAFIVFAFSLCAGIETSTAADAGTNTITLAECFQKVLAHHEELLRLRKDIERAAGSRIEFHSHDLAQLSIEPAAGVEGGNLYVHTKPFALVTAQFSQPLFNTGMAPNWRRGNLDVLTAEQHLNAAVADRLHEARIYYLRAQRLRELIALHEELERRLQANVTSERQRHEIGHTGPRPELQARIQLLAGRADLTEFRREEFATRSELAEMAGEPVDPPPFPAEPLKIETFILDSKAQAQVAHERRPDLKFLRALIRLADEDRRIAEAGYFPFISLIGSSLYLPAKRQIYQATPIIQGQNPLGTDIRGGASLTWQIVDNGSVTGVSRSIKSVREQYEIILHQLEQNIPRELERVALSFENADNQFKALEKSSVAADESLRLVQDRIALGEATQLDFSDAQRDLLAVRHAMVDAKFQHALALAELDRVTGRYLEFAETVARP